MDYRIVVDAGHGGSDPGAVSGSLKESDFNLEAALYMYNRFNELGVPVVITRDTDRTLTRSERLNTMKSFGTDSNVIILSNHINAGGGEGAEIVYPLRSDEELAKNILEEIGNAGQIKRKVYQRVLPENPSQDYYYIMRETPDATALLIEYGFIDNPNDVVKLQNNITDYAEAVVKAVSNYIGVKYVSPSGEVIDSNTYIVRKGDTLYSISRMFNMSVNELKRLNNLTNDNLSIGQVLLINSDNNSSDNNLNDSLYTVVLGDNLYSIANKYGVSVVDIINLNNLTSTVLIPGQVLTIPGSIPIYTTYIVKRGDTLYGIAYSYGVSVDDIKNLNNLTNNNLSVGQRLQIPLKEITSSNFVYTVKAGDTLFGIASNFGLTVLDIINSNNLDSTNLFIGQELFIPQK